jgi:toxin ParE1/3/4
VRRVLIAPVADADATIILDYIAQDNPAAAKRLRGRFRQLLHTLAQHPLMGRSVPELAPNLRVASVGSFLIFYRMISERVEVARILHGAREITPEFFTER